MKKSILTGAVLLLSGCASPAHDVIIGHWKEAGVTCGSKPFCSFSVEAGGMLSNYYTIKFDVVTPDFPNTGTLTPKGQGTYRYTDIGTSKGILMYIDKGFLIETHNGTKFERVAGK